MRVLFSSDWRLGRAFHGADLLAEQTALVDQVVATACERRVGAVLLAGGLLDSFASPEARDLLEHAFCRLVLEEKIPVVALIDEDETPVGRGLLSRVGLHLFGAGADPARPVELSDEHGALLVHALPHCDDAPALAEAVSAASGAGRRSARSLLLGRLPEATDTALPPAKAWRHFAAACFGGRSRAEELIAGRVWVAGSPLAWDFDDAEGERFLCLLQIDAKGETKREELPVRASRAVRRLEGRAADLLRAESIGDSLRLVVTDEGLVTELSDLRQRFPGLLEIDRPAPVAGATAPADLFEAYHSRVEGEPLSAGERALLDEALS